MELQIQPRDLARQVENGHAVRWVDVRQPWEHQIARLPNSQLIPLSELPRRWNEIPAEPSETVIVYCHHGVRSLTAVEYLRKLGVSNTQSLVGGIDAWSCEIDPTIPRY